MKTKEIENYTNNIKTITSMECAEMIGKKHFNLLRDINTYVQQLGELNFDFSDFFIKSYYISEQNKPMPCYNITRKGCEFIAHKLTGTKGAGFTAKYINKFHELENYNNNTTQSLINTLNSISQSLNEMRTEQIKNRNDTDIRLSALEESLKNNYLTTKKYPSAWYQKMSIKFKMLMEYFDCTRRELYSNIYRELENLYDIDIEQIYEDYCYDNRLSKDECYVMDAIEHNTELRKALTMLIDDSLVKYKLQTREEISHIKRKTLFDKEPEYGEAINSDYSVAVS